MGQADQSSVRDVCNHSSDGSSGSWLRGYGVLNKLVRVSVHTPIGHMGEDSLSETLNASIAVPRLRRRAQKPASPSLNR